MSSAATYRPVARLLTWLGGANHADSANHTDIADRAEESGYRTAGVLVAVNAVVTAVVVAAVVGPDGAAGWIAGVGAGLVAGAVGRLLAGTMLDPDARPGRRLLGNVARAGLAVVIGIVVGELAAVGVLAGTLGGELGAQAASARAAALHSEPARWLDALETERAALDQAVTDAAARRDHALVVARCEYRPGPGCPPNQITGDPGAGPETRQTDAALAAEEANLAAARARRDRTVPGLDQDIARARTALDAERARAEASVTDPGIGQRWIAMNASTARDANALALRIGVVAVFVLLNLLPLLLRLLRGHTEQDRAVRARRLVERAEREAGAEVAIKRVQVAAALELRRQDALLAGASAESLDAPEPSDRDEPLEVRAVPLEPARTPAPRPEITAAAALVPATKNPLDRLPGPLPGVARTVTGMVRPLVPGPVARVVAAAPNPVRTVRTVWEEFEELQLTFKRTRTVTVVERETTERSAEAPTVAAGPVEPETVEPETVEPETVEPETVETTVVEQLHPSRPRTEVTPAARRSLRTGRRSLPPADDA